MISEEESGVGLCRGGCASTFGPDQDLGAVRLPETLSDLGLMGGGDDHIEHLRSREAELTPSVIFRQMRIDIKKPLTRGCRQPPMALSVPLRGRRHWPGVPDPGR